MYLLYRAQEIKVLKWRIMRKFLIVFTVVMTLLLPTRSIAEDVSLPITSNLSLEIVLINTIEHIAPIGDEIIFAKQSDEIEIAGKAKPNTEITVIFKADQRKNTISNNEGDWKLKVSGKEIQEGKHSVSASVRGGIKVELFSLELIAEQPPNIEDKREKKENKSKQYIIFGIGLILLAGIISGGYSIKVKK